MVAVRGCLPGVFKHQYSKYYCPIRVSVWHKPCTKDHECRPCSNAGALHAAFPQRAPRCVNHSTSSRFNCLIPFIHAYMIIHIHTYLIVKLRLVTSTACPSSFNIASISHSFPDLVQPTTAFVHYVCIDRGCFPTQATPAMPTTHPASTSIIPATGPGSAWAVVLATSLSSCCPVVVHCAARSQDFEADV